MIANQKVLYKLAQKWTDTDIKHLTWLYQLHPTYYKYLQQIQKFGPVHPNKMIFRIYNTPTKLCLTNQFNYFHCYDCSLMANAGLCVKCFDFNKHKGHQWSYIQMKNKVYCDCGNKSKILSQCMCQLHKKETYKEGQTLSLLEVNLFNIFYTIYLKLLITKIEDKVNKSWIYFGNLMNFLIELNDRNFDYNKATCEMLNTVFAKNSTQQNILRKLFQISFKNQKFTQEMLKLFTILKNCDQFEYFFAQALFKQNKLYGMYQDPALLKYFYQQIQNFQILNNLATKGIINCQSSNDYGTKILNFYTQIIEKKEKNNNLHLMQVWKYIFKQRMSLFQSCILLKCQQSRKNPIKKNYFFIVMMDSVTDLEFFQQLINFYIQKWKNSGKQSYQSKSSIYNQFVRICLYAVKGEINQFPNLFQTCNKDKLTKFIYSYLSQILDPSFSKCRFNNLTMKCILKVIQQYNLNCININCMSSSYSSLKFARILAIVIRNMTAYKYNEDFDIYKIAMQTKNIDLANQKQQKILKWFKQFLFMKGEISKNLIKQFELQGITNIKKIKEFFITSTSYKKTNNLFLYIGQQVPSNLNILLDILYTKNQIYGIHWDDSKNLFYNQDNCEMLTYLFNKVIEKVELDNYNSYQNSYKYLICVTAIILNKITNQQNQKFKQYVVKLRQISENFKKLNPQVQRLFRIKSYKIKQQNQKKEILIKKQETTIIDQINQPIIKVQQIQKTIQISQKLEKLQLQEKQQEIQVPKIIQKTPSQARRHQKKNEKMKKFSQKLANRSQKFLDPSKMIQQTSQQVCLVCKETTNNFSILFYYGSLQKNKSTILYKLYTNKQKLDLNYNLTSCYHSIHETCSQKFSKKCILCSTPSDLLIPVLQKSLDNETKNIFLMIWWNENFKTTLNKKGVNSKLANQLYFFILFKSLVANLGLKSLMTSKSVKNSSSKNKRALQFLNQIYKAHQNKQKLSIILQIQQYIKQNSLQNAKFMNKIQSILSTLILSKLQNDLDKPNIQIQKWVYEKLQQLSKQFEFIYSQQIVKNIGQLVGRQYQQFNQIFKNKPETIQLWKHLQFLKEVPQNLQILKQSCKLCPKCNYPTSYYCISCNTNICSKCVNIGIHLKTQRCIAIDFQGCIVYEQDNNMIKNPLYINFLYDTCRSNKSNWSDYKFDKNALYEVLNKILSQ